jgi:hypothetical protein
MYYVMVSRMGLSFRITIETSNQEGIPAKNGEERQVYGPIQGLDMALAVRADVRDSLQQSLDWSLAEIKRNLDHQKRLTPPQK